MKKHGLVLIIAGCLMCLLVGQTNAENQAANTPTSSGGMGGGGGGGVAISVPGVRMSTGGGGLHMDLGMSKQPSVSVLLVPAKPADGEVLSQLTEDMQVMSMIFLDQVTDPDAAVPNYMAFGGRFSMGFLGRRFMSASNATWIDGYGAVFSLEVDFPLVAIGEDEQAEPQDAEEKTDEVWQRNKNRLKGLDQPAAEKDKADAVVFDPERVKQLRERLTGAMKHVSNIRNLSSKDRVVVVVSSVIDGEMLSALAVGDASVMVPTSVMTLQAAKQDIDAFATGKIDADTFTQKVTVVIY